MKTATINGVVLTEEQIREALKQIASEVKCLTRVKRRGDVWKEGVVIKGHVQEMYADAMRVNSGSTVVDEQGWGYTYEDDAELLKDWTPILD